MTLSEFARAEVDRRASMRPRLIAVDDPSFADAYQGAMEASMRPRLIAVDDPKRLGASRPR